MTIDRSDPKLKAKQMKSLRKSSSSVGGEHMGQLVVVGNGGEHIGRSVVAGNMDESPVLGGQVGVVSPVRSQSQDVRSQKRQ